MITRILITFLLLTTCALSFSQESSIGAMLGFANYQGDLSEKQITLSETKPAGGVFVRRQIMPSLSMRGSLFGSQISGSDFNYESRVHRGLTFKSLIIEGSFMIEWDMLGKWRELRRDYNRSSFTPFAGIGFGLVYFNPKVSGFETSNDANVEDMRRGKITFNVMIPIAAGFKYDISREFTIGVDAITHLPFTDYLDGVSLSGEPGNNDWYVYGGLFLQYWVTNEKLERKRSGKKI